MEKGFYELLLDFTIHMAQEVFDYRVSHESLSTWDLYEMREELDLLYNMKITEWPTLVRLSKKYTLHMLKQEGADKQCLKYHLYNLNSMGPSGLCISQHILLHLKLNTMAKFSDDPIWVTQKGEKLHLSEMSDYHLINCLNLMRRTRNWRTHFIAPIFRELRRRGLLFSWWFYEG